MTRLNPHQVKLLARVQKDLDDNAKAHQRSRTPIEHYFILGLVGLIRDADMEAATAVDKALDAIEQDIRYAMAERYGWHSTDPEGREGSCCNSCGRCFCESLLDTIKTARSGEAT